MAEIIFIILLILISRAFFMMLSCPNCRTIKSIFSQVKIKEIDEDDREKINCKTCNYSWKRLPFSGSDGGGGGGFG